MRLIACPDCHTQYDVTEVVEPTVVCRCGQELENRDFEAVEARVHRCGSCGAQLAGDASDCQYCGSQIVRDEAKLSLICPECYGRNSDDARFCTACGVTFSPERVEVKGVELPCPCCGCLMAVRALIGITINECAECNGVWVPGDKIEVLIDRAIEARKRALESDSGAVAPRKKGANPHKQRVQYRKCPECEAFMARRNFRKASGIIIDRCTEHGTWLDADELEEMAGFILSGGRPQAEAAIKQQEESDRQHRPSSAAIDFEQVRSFGSSNADTNGGGVLLNILYELLR
ncbi:MAG: zf-TFIIB domain-containing protein [Deltaproteobacteria bacterium]|nr:zf-TFIIB domain-containing protein [Deltaproteobacteria bacterium]